MRKQSTASHYIILGAILLSGVVLWNRHDHQGLPPGPTAGDSQGARNSPVRVPSGTSIAGGFEARAKQLQTLLKQNDPVELSRATLKLMDGVAPEDYRRLLDACRERHVSSSAETPRLLLTAWASLDPGSALAYALGDRDAVKVVLDRWSIMDAEKALRWTLAHPRQADVEVSGILAARVIRSQPERIDELLGSLSIEARNAALAILTPEILSRGTTQAQEWLDKIGDPRSRTLAFYALVEALPPAEALDWIEFKRAEILSGALEGNTCGIFNTWLERDLGAATAAFEKLPAGDLIHKDALRAMLQSGKAQEDPQWGKDLMDRYPDEIDHGAVLGLCFVAIHKNPLLAMELATRADSFTGDSGAQLLTLETWFAQDPEGAREWVRSHKVPPALERYKTDP